MYHCKRQPGKECDGCGEEPNTVYKREKEIIGCDCCVHTSNYYNDNPYEPCICPECLTDCETLYINESKYVLGCDCCVKEKYADEMEEEE